jgi:hypothetical protein
MTLRTILALGVTTLAIGTSAGAFATEASAYRYGMNLDIAQVVTVEAPTAIEGHSQHRHPDLPRQQRPIASRELQPAHHPCQPELSRRLARRGTRT